jgi:hypothetical protein
MRRIVALAVLLLAAVPQGAGAATYCVPDPPGAPSACELDGGIGKSSLQAALDAAQSNAGPDSVKIAATAPAFIAGGTYLSSDPLEIVGAGRGQTRIAGGGTVLSLGPGTSAPVSVSDLSVLVQPGTGGTGVRLDGARAARVDVATDAGADGSRAVVLANGAGFRSGRLSLGAGSAAGLAASGGASNSVDDLLVELSGGSTAGVLAESPTGGDVTLNARHVTVVGSGGGGQIGAGVNATAAGQTAALNVRNSILHAVGHPLSRTASGGGTAQLAVDYSNYGGSGNVSSGSGGIAEQGTTNAPPSFVDPAGRDFRLSAGSALIDAGEPGALSGIEPPEDLAGNTRILNGNSDCVPRRDVGAYEFLSSTLFVSASVSPTTVVTGQAATFDGSACDPEPTAALGYGWSFDDGGTASGARVPHAFATPGAHAGTLTVTSSTGRSGSTTKTVQVSAPPPPARQAGPVPRRSRTSPRSLVLIAARVVALTRGGIAAVPVRCSGTRRCSGVLTLATARPVSLSRKRIVKLGAARFSIAAKRRAKVRVRLSASRVRLVKRVKRLRVKVTVTDRDNAGRRRTGTRTVLLKAR